MLTPRRVGKLLYLVLVAGLLVLSPGAAPSLPIRAAPGSPDPEAAPQGVLGPDGAVNLTTGLQGTLDLGGWDVTSDAARGSALKPATSSATLSTSGWHPMPNQGRNHTVYALAMVGDDLYIGGVFNDRRIR